MPTYENKRSGSIQKMNKTDFDKMSPQMRARYILIEDSKPVTKKVESKKEEKEETSK